MLILDEQTIRSLAAPAALVEVMGQAFRTPAQAPTRSHHALGAEADDGVLLLMPAWRAGGSIGVKIASVMPRNAAKGQPTVGGLYVLLAADGSPRALLDAKELTLARTAAVSALAASLLARPDARTLLMVGTGALAPDLVRAHAAVRAFERILVWGRSPDKAQALAARLAGEGLEAQAVTDLDTAVPEADVISCATLSETALVRGANLRPGAHLDLVGGFTPAMRETDDEAIRRAGVFVDTMAALHEAGDLAQPLASGLLAADRITDLSALVRAGPRVRTDGEITLFKAVGTAISDLAAAEYLVARHEASAT
jgi:ornithine cyclodeaminase